jgi:regulator of nucleoside diphosphate kinase
MLNHDVRNDHSAAEAMPAITMTAEDHARLSTLARAAADRMPEAASALDDELGRAVVLAPGRAPERIVRMGSEVEFRDDGSGKMQVLTLVYPEDADIAKGRISVLTPVGTALIGLHPGASITWRTRGGALRRLTVIQVRQPVA